MLTHVAIIYAMLFSVYSLPMDKKLQPQCISGKLDLVLVVDVSGSSEQKYNTNRQVAWELASSVPISFDKASVAIIQYSRLALMRLEFSASQTWENINDTILNLEWTGDVSQTAEAMDLAMIQFRKARPDSTRVIVLIHDGNSFNSWQTVQETAERLRYSNAKIHAVNLAGNTYMIELHQYTDFSNGSIILRQSDLDKLKKELRDLTVPHCPPPAAAPPTDFLRPAENNQEENGGDQLPTRKHSETRRTTRRHNNNRPHSTTSTLPSTANNNLPSSSTTTQNFVTVTNPFAIVDNIDKELA